MARYFLFVEPNLTTSRLFAERVRNYGCEPVFATTKPLGFYKHAENAGIRFLRCDAPSFAELLQRAKTLETVGKIVGVSSSGDRGIELAARLARHLNLEGGDPEAIKSCRDKHYQRAVCAEHKRGDVPYALCTNVSDAVAAARAIGFPVVVKPSQGTGSYGVLWCDTAEAVERHIDTLLKESATSPFIVEKFIEGEQFSLEIFDGRFLGAVRQHYSPLPHFVALGHDFPAKTEPALLQRLQDFSTWAVQAFNLAWGPLHLEVRVDQEGAVKLIEVNARLAGAYVPELVRHATGIDLIDLTLRRHLGLPSTPESTSRLFGVLRFATVHRPVVVVPAMIPLIDDMLRDVHLYHAPGTHLERQNDMRDRYGFAICVAKDYQEAALRADSVVRMFQRNSEGL